MRAVVQPFRAAGTVRVPASKSELHRLLIAAALADRETRIAGCAGSEDVRATIRCLAALGAEIRSDENGYAVKPLPLTPRREQALLDCGESGSTLRFLLPVAAALGAAEFTGRGRLPERPIGPLLREMALHGAVPSADKLPLTVSGHLSGGVFTLPGNISSQFVTGLMLAAPLLGETEIRIEGSLESMDYVRMTAAAQAVFGVETEVSEHCAVIHGGQRYCSPGQTAAGGDWSGAAFPLCLGALGGPVSVTGLDLSSTQGDRSVIGILRSAGAKVCMEDGSATVSGSALSALELDVSGIPDLVPSLAALLMHARGRSVFYHAGRLRLKESDRLASTCAMVNALGGQASVCDDRLIVDGRTHCAGGVVDGSGDHRIVMAALIGASACAGASEICGVEAAAKSWPAFFEDMQLLGGKINVVDIR